jgi:tRNA(Ile)-lysidine synthase
LEHLVFPSTLQTTKNLLAFSAGVDSTALFFLLLDHQINFAIAMVDYNLREQSKEEVTYAHQLAKKYHKKIYIKSVHLEGNNLEATARSERYNFFDDICQNEGYDTLLTAHQLNDQLEWFLMQLTKGAGLAELLGMEIKVERKNFTIIRPLLTVAKSDLQAYLDNRSIKYFFDHTNEDTALTRNHFRHTFSNELIKHYKNGIKRSFSYLEHDKSLLINEINYKAYEKLYIFKKPSSDRTMLFHIDKLLKEKFTYRLSSDQREEILEQEQSVIGRKIVVARNEKSVFLAPFVTGVIMPKQFKEACRVKNIPTKIRPYLLSLSIDIFTIEV